MGGAAAVFKDLCVDAVDASRSAAFYAALLGRAPDPERCDPRRPVRLTGERDEQTLWVNPVPEPTTVKNRVHLDVHARSATEVLRLGATPVAEREHWTVVADPDGQELCVFVTADPPADRLSELNVDAADPARVAHWWGERLAVSVRHEPGSGEEVDWWAVGSRQLPVPFVFAAVPEPKTVKNRVHWDVWGDAADLLDAGATLVREPDDHVGWHVLADPEGNEFCVFAR